MNILVRPQISVIFRHAKLMPINANLWLNLSSFFKTEFFELSFMFLDVRYKVGGMGNGVVHRPCTLCEGSPFGKQFCGDCCYSKGGIKSRVGYLEGEETRSSRSLSMEGQVVNRHWQLLLATYRAFWRDQGGRAAVPVQTTQIALSCPIQTKVSIVYDSDFFLSFDLIRHVSFPPLSKWSKLSNHEDPIGKRSKVPGFVNTMVLPKIKGAPRYKIP